MEIIEITRSRLRKELLKYYFMHPEGRFYLRELEKLLRFPVANIRRELQKLKRLGFFDSQKVGNLVYFFLNKKCPLYNEIKSIVLKTAGIGDILRENLCKIKGIDCAFIFGSFAKDEERSSSDIDLMIIGDFSQEKLLPIIHKIENLVGRSINPVSFSLAEVNERIKRKNHFTLNVFRDKKIMIIGEEDELPRIRN